MNALFLCAAISAGVGAGYVAMSWERAYTPNPNGLQIASLETLEVNGQKHFLTIRGRSTSLPVLIYIHGGPGASDIPFIHKTDNLLEEHFIVVHYDQRSAGKSSRFYDGKTELSIKQHLNDAISLTKTMLKRYNKEKAFLLGGSWGTLLALMAAKYHPELFHAVLLRGLLVNTRLNEELSREFIIRQLGENVAAKVPKPPYGSDASQLMKQRMFLYQAGGMEFQRKSTNPVWFQLSMFHTLFKSPEISFGDIFRMKTSLINTLTQMWPEIQEFDAYAQVSSLDIPMYIFHGRHDHCTVASLVEDYFDNAKAPEKKLVWFENSAHSPQREESELFQKLAIKHFLK